MNPHRRVHDRRISAAVTAVIVSSTASLLAILVAVSLFLSSLAHIQDARQKAAYDTCFLLKHVISSAYSFEPSRGITLISSLPIANCAAYALQVRNEP